MRNGTNQFTHIELYEVPEATDVAIVPPGSVAKIEVMRLRVSRGEAVFHEEDRDIAYFQQHGGDVATVLKFTIMGSRNGGSSIHNRRVDVRHKFSS